MEECLHPLRFLWWIGGSFMDCSGRSSLRACGFLEGEG